ncbi:MAG TPA: LysR family transcriptional regulator [Rhodopila sp.]|jgi:DNA-binding transcriptional LysR family regulator
MIPPSFTLNQLRIFLAVAHSRSLTRAAKLLDQTQPSLSQHIAKLEEAVGQLLFERGRGQFELTEAGAFLCRRADAIMAEVDKTMVGLAAHAKGVRGVLSVGMLSSVARNLLPDVQMRMAETFPDVELDVHEVAPAEAVEMLYTRRLTVAVVAAGSVASGSLSFLQSDVFSDPYVLAVPRSLDLSQVTDPDTQLEPRDRLVLNSVLQFTFGSPYQMRIADWYQHHLPTHRVVGRVRSYELALALVQSGRGVAIVPGLSARVSAGTSYGVRLYDIGMEHRRVVALMPSQYLTTEPQATFVAALRAVGSAIEPPPVEPVPPFLRADLPTVAAAQ